MEARAWPAPAAPAMRASAGADRPNVETRFAALSLRMVSLPIMMCGERVAWGPERGRGGRVILYTAYMTSGRLCACVRASVLRVRGAHPFPRRRGPVCDYD